jgi:ABC-2 type transport system permease protein
MSLYRTELRRLAKRRVTRVMLGLLALTMVGIVLALGASSQRIGPEQLAAAQATADDHYEQNRREHERTVQECRAAEARGEEDVVARYGPDCGADFAPKREDFSADWFLPYQFNFRLEFAGMLTIFVGLMGAFAFMVGASFVGAEWSSGGMANLLLWRPERATVLGAKLGALLTALTGLAVGLGALWTGGIWLVAEIAGTTDGMTTGAWTSFALTGARLLGLVLVAGAVAFGLASLGRHTATAFGVLVAVLVVGEVGLHILLDEVGAAFPGRFLPSTYLLAWMEKSWLLVDFSSCGPSAGVCRPAEYLVTWQQSGALFAVVAALVLGAAFWAIRRRDVS